MSITPPSRTISDVALTPKQPKQLDADTNPPPDYVSDWRVFWMLDSLSPTATGLDGLPAWFLPATILYKHVAFLFNLSLATSTVAQQWKEASITPVPKIAIPTQHSDFRPILITPILTCMTERTVIRTFLYPAFLAPPPSLTFSDQFAFCPTGSTSAAIISLLHTITSLLQANPMSLSHPSTSPRPSTLFATQHYCLR